MSNEKQVKDILKVLSIGKTIAFFNWSTKEKDNFTKTEKGFINTMGEKVTIDYIANNYRACDNILV